MKPKPPKRKPGAFTAGPTMPGDVRRKRRIRRAIPEGPSTLLLAREVSADLYVAINTLARWRTVGYGPPFMRYGGLIRYPVKEYEEWKKKNTFKSIAAYHEHDSTEDPDDA